MNIGENVWCVSGTLIFPTKVRKVDNQGYVKTDEPDIWFHQKNVHLSLDDAKRAIIIKNLTR